MTYANSASIGEESALLPSSADDNMPSDVAGSTSSKREARKGDTLALVILVIGLGLFVGAVGWVVAYENWSSLGSPFSYHPSGQTLGIALLVIAIGQLQPTANAHSKARGLRLHQSLILMLSLPAFVIGSSAMYYNKAKNGSPHFTTWHAWCGLATMSVMFLQIAFGVATVTPALSGLLGGPAKAKRYYKYHRALGYVLIGSLLFTAHLGGAHSTWSLSPAVSSGARITAFWVALPLIALGLYARLRPSKLGL